MSEPTTPRAPRRSDAFFRQLVDSISDYGIFMLDPEGYVQTWNAGAGRISGYDATEIIGQHFSVFYPPE
jgi:PAS domain S-box-containing protein